MSPPPSTPETSRRRRWTKSCFTSLRTTASPRGRRSRRPPTPGKPPCRTSTSMSGAARRTTPPSASRRSCRFRPRPIETDDGHRGDAGAARELEPRASQRMTLRGAPEQSAPAGRPQSQRPDEVVDLTVALAVDDAPRLALRGATGGTREPTALVAVLDRLDVPEVTGEAVELGPGRAHCSTFLTMGPLVSRHDPPR